MAGRPRGLAFYRDLVSGLAFIAVGIVLLYVLFGGVFMTRFLPTGRPSTYDLIIGALAFSFVLTVPAAFVFMGVARLSAAYRRWRARRPEPHADKGAG